MDLATGIALASLVVSIVGWWDSRRAIGKAAKLAKKQAKWDAARSFVTSLHEEVRDLLDEVDFFSRLGEAAALEFLKEEGRQANAARWVKDFAPKLDGIQRLVESLPMHFPPASLARVQKEWAQVFEFEPRKRHGALPRAHWERSLKATLEALESLMKAHGMYGEDH